MTFLEKIFTNSTSKNFEKIFDFISKSKSKMLAKTIKYQKQKISAL